MTTFMEVLQIESIIDCLIDGMERELVFSNFEFQDKHNAAYDDYIDPPAHAWDREFEVDLGFTKRRDYRREVLAQHGHFDQPSISLSVLDGEIAVSGQNAEYLLIVVVKERICSVAVIGASESLIWGRHLLEIPTYC